MKRMSKHRLAYDKAHRIFVQDSARFRLPKGAISILNHFFRHVTDAMGGDDRPDHGLARMRQGRDYYRTPFLFLRHALMRAERRLTKAQQRRASNLLYKMMEAEKAWDEEFTDRMRPKKR